MVPQVGAGQLPSEIFFFSEKMYSILLSLSYDGEGGEDDHDGDEEEVDRGGGGVDHPGGDGQLHVHHGDGSHRHHHDHDHHHHSPTTSTTGTTPLLDRRGHLDGDDVRGHGHRLAILNRAFLGLTAALQANMVFAVRSRVLSHATLSRPLAET